MKRPRWLIPAVKVAILALLAWGLSRTIRGAIADLQRERLELDLLWLTGAGGLYFLSMLPAALFWQRVMRAMGERSPAIPTLRAYCIGHLGKYVPGKAMVVLLRTGLLRPWGVRADVAAVSVFFETLTLMAAGACLSALVVGVWYAEQRLLLVMALGLMVLSGVPTLPPLLARLMRWTAIGRKYPGTAARIAGVDYTTLAGGWTLMFASWALQGLSLAAVLRGMGLDDVQPAVHLPQFTASIALAVVAGFLSFLPGGLGARDAVLMLLLAPQLGTDGEGKALVATILLRLVWLVVELAISGILYPVCRRPREQRSEGEASAA